MDATEMLKAGHYGAAASIYAAVLKADPQNIDAEHLLGLTHYHQKNLPEAKRLISSALRRAPNQPQIHHNYAAVLSILGDHFAAEGHFREAIRLKPNYGEAFYNLSAVIKLRSDDPIIEQIEDLLNTDGLSNVDRCFLHFAAGKLLDDVSYHDRAFNHYAKGNAEKGARYQRDLTEKFAEAMKQVYTADFLRERAADAYKTNLPVFIVGMPRSGTSLLEQILASHSKVHGAGEISDIVSISKAVEKHADRQVQYPFALAETNQDILLGLAKSYIERMRKLAPGADRVINKMPLNFWHLGLIETMFSHAQIIHCRRDPLDTCLSCYFQNFTNGQDYAFDLEDLGHFYRLYDGMMDHWRTISPLPILEVNYEDLVSHTEAVTREILSFMGLEWEPACTQSHLTDRSVHTASRWQVRQPIYQTSRRRWRRYEDHISPLLTALSDTVQHSP